MTNEQLAKLEGFEDVINDIRQDMIAAILQAHNDGAIPYHIEVAEYTKEYLDENYTTDELCDICLSFL